MKRVVVTGMGMVSPIGHDLPSSWNALLNGESGIQSYLNDPVLHNDKPFNLALIKNFDTKKWKVPHASSRLNSFLVKSTQQALQQGQVAINQLDATRVGVCIGSMASSLSKLVEFAKESHQDNYKTINRLAMLQVVSNISAAALGVQYQLKGPSMAVSTACATGLSAIIEGVKWIRLNQADVVIVGSSDDVYNPLYLYGNLRIQAMSSKVYDKPEMSSRPFDKQRSGFIMGEGSGVLILESLEHATKRKAPIQAQILGYGQTSDGYHLVRPAPSGEGQTRAIRQAISSSGLNPSDIDHINVHATSTLAGDEIEALSIKSIFGEMEKKPSISAIKSSIGHTMSSAGAIESIFGIMSLQNSVAPKIMNLYDADVEGLNYARQNLSHPITTMVKNSFGFGGVNLSCVFKKFEG